MIRLFLALLAGVLAIQPATAQRVKDLGGFQGIRTNQLTGYGVVVGLPGTGDDNLEYTVQSVKAVASRFGDCVRRPAVLPAGRRFVSVQPSGEMVSARRPPRLCCLGVNTRRVRSTGG